MAIRDDNQGFWGAFVLFSPDDLDKGQFDRRLLELGHLAREFQTAALKDSATPAAGSWIFHLFAIFLPTYGTGGGQHTSQVETERKLHGRIQRLQADWRLLEAVGLSLLFWSDRTEEALGRWASDTATDLNWLSGATDIPPDLAAHGDQGLHIEPEYTQVEEFFAPLLLHLRALRGFQGDVLDTWRRQVEMQIAHLLGAGFENAKGEIPSPIQTAAERYLARVAQGLQLGKPVESAGTNCRLERLELTGYRRFRERQVIPFGRFTVVYGENGTGKTAIAEALEIWGQGWVRRLGKERSKNDTRVLNHRLSTESWQGRVVCGGSLYNLRSADTERFPVDAVILSQQELAHFVRADADERAAMITRLFGVDLNAVEEWANQVRTEIRTRLQAPFEALGLRLPSKGQAAPGVEGLIEGLAGRLIPHAPRRYLEQLDAVEHAFERAHGADGVLAQDIANWKGWLEEGRHAAVALRRSYESLLTRLQAGESALVRDLNVIRESMEKLQHIGSRWYGSDSYRTLAERVLAFERAKAPLRSLPPELPMPDLPAADAALLAERRREVGVLRSQVTDLRDGIALSNRAAAISADLVVRLQRVVQDVQRNQHLQAALTTAGADPTGLTAALNRMAELWQQVVEGLAQIPPDALPSEQALAKLLDDLTVEDERVAQQLRYTLEREPAAAARSQAITLAREEAMALLRVAYPRVQFELPLSESEFIQTLEHFEPLSAILGLKHCVDELVRYLNTPFPETSEFVGEILQRYYADDEDQVGAGPGVLSQAWNLLKDRETALNNYLTISLNALSQRLGGLLVELVHTLSGPRWGTPPLNLQVERVRREMKAELRARFDQYDAPVRTIANVAMQNVLGLSWFLLAYLIVGKRFSKAVIIDDPMQSMDDVNLTIFLRVFRYVMAAAEVEQVVVLIHQPPVLDYLTDQLAGGPMQEWKDSDSGSEWKEGFVLVHVEAISRDDSKVRVDWAPRRKGVITPKRIQGQLASV